MPTARFMVSGRVQGVFFRASTREQAVGLGLAGHATNRADGSVEVIASGSTDALDALEREYYLRIGAQYTHYFDGKRHFDTAAADELLGAPAPCTDSEYLRVLLDYCLESGYLGAPLPGIEEVLECVR